MHPATVAAGSRTHHHHPDAYQKPPPYNPDEYFKEHNSYQGQPPLPQHLQPQQPWGPVYQGPAAPAPPQPTTVIIQHPSPAMARNYTALRGLPHHSTTSTCTNCGQVVSTRVVHRTSCKTHLWACCLFIFLCWPCICVPYCKDSCMTANHYCTRCDSFLGDSSNS